MTVFQRKTLSAAAVLLLLSLAPVHAHFFTRADSVFHVVLNHVSFLPENFIQSDLSGYALQKNDDFKQQRLAEWNTSTGFVFLSVLKNRLQSIWDVDFSVGFGNIPGDIVFTVLSANFGVVPSIKINLDPLDIMTGIDHRCFHRVDRNDFGIVYWNRAFLEARSNNWRINEYWAPLGIDRKWDLKNRISGRFGTGYYVKEFFGLVEPQKIDGHNHRFGEVYTDGRFAFLNRESWVFVGTGGGKVGLFSKTGNGADDLGPFWQLDFGCEAHFCRGKKGALVYVKYLLDDLPVIPGMPDFSKDQLLQFGVKFFN